MSGNDIQELYVVIYFQISIFELLKTTGEKKNEDA